jgi:hypothetical protein
VNPKPVIIASLCAVLFVVAVYFGGKYALDQRRAEYSKQSKRSLTKRKTRRVAKPTETTENSPSNTPTTNELIDEQETSVTSEPAPTVDIELSTTVEEAETPQTEDEPVSPHGFGPYPEVPDDYIAAHGNPPWMCSSNNNFSSSTQGGLELIARVLIKLWNQGDRRFISATLERGKVYPNYPNTIYVRYKEIKHRDGTIFRYISSSTSAGDNPEAEEEIFAGKIPTGVTLIDMESEDAGIDPYAFLGIDN